MDNLRTAVLILAAGLSSRMGDFKPLMKIGENRLIQHTLNTFRTIEASQVVVITGHRSLEIAQHLSGQGIVLIKNEDYNTTDMFCSIKLGLKYLLGKCDRVFIMPADIPLVTPFCIEEMSAYMQQYCPRVLKPTYKGRGGHPVLISSRCFGYILQYSGAAGLKGALKSSNEDVSTLPLPEPAILMDADTRERFAALEQYAQTKDIPSRQLAMEILQWHHVSESIKQHSVAVACLAKKLGKLANKKGIAIDMHLIQASALLHDLEKKSGRDHPYKGSVLLKRMGFDRVAKVVNEHMDISPQAIECMDERAIVYLADKLIQGDKRVTVQSRRDELRTKFADNKQAAYVIEKRHNNAQVILNRLGIDNVQVMKL